MGFAHCFFFNFDSRLRLISSFDFDYRLRPSFTTYHPPIRLRHYAESCIERREECPFGRRERIQFAIRKDAKPFDVIGSEAERPVVECGIEPIPRRTICEPILANDRICRRGEIIHFIRTNPRQHKATGKIFRSKSSSIKVNYLGIFCIIISAFCRGILLAS